ncbi:MAG: dihydropteroate synthase [Chitinispirillaceae bacterium]|nr:dihydropteroate synthase [Chitinispirillaceae bacterium]
MNTTPDSFYDGGHYLKTDKAVDHGMRLVSEGASVIDIGGASSRPGAPAVPPDEEMRRILPVVRKLARTIRVPISVDTCRSSVARAALDAGAEWINDISAGRNDPAMAPLAAQRGCTIVLMHMRGTPQTMQTMTTYDDVVEDARKELLAATEKFLSAGVARNRIVIDPGIGFAKTASQNIRLLQGLGAFVNTGFAVLLGTSRKSFIGRITGREVEDRLAGTLGSVAAAFMRGVRLFRVHDVAATADFLKVVSTIEHPDLDGST